MPQSNQEPMETKLRRISEVASRNTQEQFTNLVHLLNRNNLKECFCMLKRKSAVGVDGISWEEYGSNPGSNL
jgi:RNA-directed DNA polymerase